MNEETPDSPHIPDSGDIPELFERLAPRLLSPDPADIRTRAAHRSEVRRRALTVCGALTLVASVIGGVWAMNNDDQVSQTATAGDDTEQAISTTTYLLPVADDSPPRLVGELPLPTDNDEFDVFVDEYAFTSSVDALDCPGAIFRSAAPLRTEDIVGDTDAMTAILRRAEPFTDLVLQDISTVGDGSQVGVFTNDQDAVNLIVAVVEEVDGWHVAQSFGCSDTGSDDVALGIIPDLAGVDVNEALNILFGMDMRTSRVDEASDTVERGRVIRTEPASGTTVEERTVISLVVSSGPAEINMPVDIINAVLSIEADIDGQPGVEEIWLDPDGTLHAGDLTGYADYWDIDDYWFDERAELTTEVFDDDTMAVVLSLPIQEEEDPPNVVQVFLVTDAGLFRAFGQTLGTYGVHPLTFGGDGTVSYVEDGWSACRDTDPADTVPLRRIILTPVGDDGELIWSSSEDTAEVQDCSQLAG